MRLSIFQRIGFEQLRIKPTKIIKDGRISDAYWNFTSIIT
jgi:hypothetical protein